MTLQDVQRYRCLAANGKEPSEGPVRKPLLAESVHAVDAEARRLGIPAPSFNIEVKSDPVLYGSFQPLPDHFAALVLQHVEELGIKDRCLIQSFDPAVLEASNRIEPHVPLALLVENTEGLEQNLARLDFTPRFYSPDVALATEELVRSLRKMGIGLLVWTVNEEAAMRRMIAHGVDGLITDNPELALRLLAADQ
jgi:glycerophosphoryl diester phosphodiesterase